MSTCPQCGATTSNEAVFCGSCGAHLSQQTVPGSPISAAVQMDEKPAPARIQGPVPGPVAGAPRARARARHLPEGTLIDQKYAVVRVLGEGGMGVVYLARDIHTGLDVVVKAIRSELAHRSDVRQRTLAEGRALAHIDHPNVVHLKAVVVDGSNLWLVMQYIDGESLEKIIAAYTARNERMPINEACSIFRQIAAGIGAAHQEGVIHRDLKPANVLIRRKDHTAKVTDFGIAKLPTTDAEREQTKGILGSLWYMSPEQVTGRRDLDPRVDIYALGIVLYQMLVGHVPFDASSDYEIMKMHAEVPMPLVRASRPDVPPALDELIQKACAKDRTQRFQNCGEVIAALDRIAGRPERTMSMPDPGITVPEALNPHGQSAVRPHFPGAPAGITAQGTALPAGTAPASGHKGKWIALGLGLAACAFGILAVLRLFPGTGRPSAKPIASSTARGPSPPSDSTKVAPPSSPRSPLEVLTGTWNVNNKDLDAVLVGDVLEFRVRTPAQFEPQDYDAGEARFALRTTDEPNVFSVEDRIRPFPPVGKTYAPRSRNSCQEVWTSAGGEPLRARYDGKRLTVEFAKIEPTSRNFTLEGSRVVDCRGLRDLDAARVVNILSRP